MTSSNSVCAVLIFLPRFCEWFCLLLYTTTFFCCVSPSSKETKVQTRHAAHLFIIPIDLYKEKVGKLLLLLFIYIIIFCVCDIYIYSTMNNK